MSRDSVISGQGSLVRDPSERTVAEPERDGFAVVCPDHSEHKCATNSGGKQSYLTDAEVFGLECPACNLTLPARCHRRGAPNFHDEFVGLKVDFGVGHERFVPVPTRFVEERGEV